MDIEGKKAPGIRSASEKTIRLLRRFLPVQQRRPFAYSRLKRSEDTEENDSNDDDDEGKEDEKEEEGNIKIKRGINVNLRRKRHPFRSIVVKKTKRKNLEIKKKKSTNKSSQIKKLSKGETKAKAKASISKNALVLRDPKDRLSTERKSMKATAETPMLRPQLRAGSRKKIGVKICARELKILKDAMNKMERDFNETKVKLEEEVGRLRREVSELSAFKKRMEEENKKPITIAASSPCTMGQLDTSLDSSKCDLDNALDLPVEKCEEQQFVKEMEESIFKLESIF